MQFIGENIVRCRIWFLQSTYHLIFLVGKDSSVSCYCLMQAKYQKIFHFRSFSIFYILAKLCASSKNDFFQM